MSKSALLIALYRSRIEAVVEGMPAPELSRIRESARHVLQKRLDSASRYIVCEFQDGIVILRGRLSSFYEKQIAQEALRSLEGVDQIVNQIEVVATT